MLEKYAIVLCAPVALANYILQTFFSEKTQTKLSHHVLKDSYTSFLMKYLRKVHVVMNMICALTLRTLFRLLKP